MYNLITNNKARVFLALGVITILIVCLYYNIQGHKLSRSDLDFLREGLRYNEVVAQIGKPDRETGSGVYWFEYDLENGEQLLLGFMKLEHLDSAVIVERDGKQKRIFPK